MKVLVIGSDGQLGSELKKISNNYEFDNICCIYPTSCFVKAKDLIKSGGEWISSIDLENRAMSHPDVENCAVIAIPHEKWDERPLLIVVPAEGKKPSKEELIKHLEGHFAKWQMPDDVVYEDALPLTATGKVSKLTLRKKYEDYTLA